MENTALSTMQGLPATKEQSRVFSAKLKEELLSGNFNILHARIFLKSVIETLTAVCDDKSIKDAIIEEADKYHEKTFIVNGSKVTKASKTTYDYSNCKDPVYDQLIRDKEKLDEQIKIRQAILKSGVDSNTGETFIPPATKTTEYLTIEIL